jgi:hypothetical protein
MGQRTRIHRVSSLIESLFPNLASAGYRITSPATPDYNCIAWAAGDEENWWWPDPFGDYFWPSQAAREETVEAYAAAYHTLGYELCSSAEVEAEFEKIALYVNASGVPTHATRQQPSGVWTSKVGQLEDIEHITLEALQGETYGSVGLILRRPNRT